MSLIKDKLIKWNLKTYFLCESEIGGIMNAKMYTSKENVCFIAILRRLLKDLHFFKYSKVENTPMATTRTNRKKFLKKIHSMLYNEKVAAIVLYNNKSIYFCL